MPALAQQVQVSLSSSTLRAANSSYHIEKLVDARPDRTRLGTVHRGLDNKIVSANFKQPLEAELLPLLQQAMPTGPATRPVIVRIHTLSIGETIRNTSEVAGTEFVVDFLEPVGDDAYRVLLSTGELVETKGLDVTSHHAANIVQVVTQSLQKLAALPTTAEPTSPTLLTWAQVVAGEDGAAAMRYPIQSQPPQRGIYRSFEEFRSNAPSNTDKPFEIVKKPRKGKQWAGTEDVEAYYFYLDAEHPRRPVYNVWGISDGQTLYINYRNRYFPLTPTATGYSFTGFRPADPGDVAAGAMLGMTLGLVGGLIAAATLPDGSAPQPYDLHISTGRVVAYAPPAVAADGIARPDTAAIYLYRRPDAQPDQLITVLVDGREIGKLAAGSYLPLRWQDRRRELGLCVRTQEAACHSFLPDFAVTTYLECSLPSGTDTAPSIQPAPIKEGIFYVKKYRLRQRTQ